LYRPQKNRPALLYIATQARTCTRHFAFSEQGTADSCRVTSVKHRIKSCRCKGIGAGLGTVGLGHCKRITIHLEDAETVLYVTRFFEYDEKTNHDR